MTSPVRSPSPTLEAGGSPVLSSEVGGASAASAQVASTLSTIESLKVDGPAEVSSPIVESQGCCAWIQSLVGKYWTAISGAVSGLVKAVSAFFASLFGGAKQASPTADFIRLRALTCSKDYQYEVTKEFYHHSMTDEQRGALHQAVADINIAEGGSMTAEAVAESIAGQDNLRSDLVQRALTRLIGDEEVVPSVEVPAEAASDSVTSPQSQFKQ